MPMNTFRLSDIAVLGFVRLLQITLPSGVNSQPLNCPAGTRGILDDAGTRDAVAQSRWEWPA
ncbi:hypothetical protein D9M68_899850 [compost metagenome]